MHVHAINTLEIRIVEEPDAPFEEKLQSLVASCEQAPGCLGYALARCPNEGGVWILSGLWSSDESLNAHYQDDSLQALLAFLMDAHASLNFALREVTQREASQDGS